MVEMARCKEPAHVVDYVVAPAPDASFTRDADNQRPDAAYSFVYEVADGDARWYTSLVGPRVALTLPGIAGPA